MAENIFTEKELEALRVSGIQVQIDERKAKLAESDYIGVKIAMGVATREEYAEQIAETERLRAEINELEKQKVINEKKV